MLRRHPSTPPTGRRRRPAARRRRPQRVGGAFHGDKIPPRRPLSTSSWFQFLFGAQPILLIRSVGASALEKQRVRACRDVGVTWSRRRGTDWGGRSPRRSRVGGRGRRRDRFRSFCPHRCTDYLSWKQKTRGEEQTNCCESTHGDRSRQQEQHGHLLNRDGCFLQG